MKLLDYNRINEEILDGLPLQALKEHISHIVGSEFNEHLRIYYKTFACTGLLCLLLIVHDVVEPFTDCHLFYMDSIDREYNNYEYHSLPSSVIREMVQTVQYPLGVWD
ncbi:MAG: hypothetical protein WDZ91_15885 [Paenibacillaceae bacterium]